MRVNPVLNLATVSREGLPHSATVWTAHGPDLDRLYWLSSPNRVHSEHIAAYQSVEEKAPVSGSMSLPQRPSRPVTGLSFEGHAARLVDPGEIDEAMDTLLTHRVFSPDEAANYLQPSEGSGVSPHGFYVAHVNKWVVFDGRKPYEQRRSEILLPPKRRTRSRKKP